MPYITDFNRFKKYIPIKHLKASNFEANDFGVEIAKDSFISLFPCLMKFKHNIFGSYENVVEMRWCLYWVNNGNNALYIGRDDSVESLLQVCKGETSEASQKDFIICNTKSLIENWYLNVASEKQLEIKQAMFYFLNNRNIVMLKKAKTEYGYYFGEKMNDKKWLFGENELHEVKEDIAKKIILTLLEKRELDSSFDLGRAIQETENILKEL